MVHGRIRRREVDQHVEIRQHLVQVRADRRPDPTDAGNLAGIDPTRPLSARSVAALTVSPSV
jgi:hypothetical protein